MTFDRKALHHVTDGAGLRHLCTLLTGQLVALDCETTQLSPFGPDARVVCIALTFCERNSSVMQTWVVGLSHPDSGLCRHWRSALTTLAEALQYSRLVAHNASFDLTWIKVHTGVNLYKRLVGDTAYLAHLLDENTSAGLKPRAIAELGADDWRDFSWKALQADELANPDGRKLAERENYYRMTEYCGEDTYWTFLLYLQYSQRLGLEKEDQEILDQAAYLDDDPDAKLMLRLGNYAQTVGLRTVVALAAVEENGFTLDADWCRQRLEANQQLIVEAEQELMYRVLLITERAEMGDLKMTPEVESALQVVCGPASWAPTSKWFQAFATLMCATGQMRVAARTAKGAVKWSKDVLDKQAREGSEVASLLRTIRVHMTESAYISSWLAEAQHDGRIRASYNYSSVVTGRLSCSGPNLQQVARSARAAFCASPGHVLVSADYSQVELRVAAFQARCEPMLEAYQEGRDLHIVSGATAAHDEALRTAQLLCLWGGVPADRPGSQVLREVFSRKGAGSSQEEIRQGVRESCLLRPDQEPWSGLGWGAGGICKPSVQDWRNFCEGRSELPYCSGDCLRGVRSDGSPWDRAGACGSPHQRKSFGQPTLESSDALRLLSQAKPRLLAEVSGVDWEDLRQKGKAIGFGFLFGMGAEKFVSYAENNYGVIFDLKEAEQIRKAFFETWDGMAQWHARQRQLAARHGFVVSPLGRIRHLPDARSSDDYLQGRAMRQAINSPVQGMASDIMMLAVYRLLEFPWIKPVAVVHDAVICEVAEESAAKAQSQIKWVMEQGVLEDMARLGCRLDVPLVADLTVGTSWAK